MRRLILGFLVVWAGFAFLAEVKEAVAGYDARSRMWLDPFLWRLGMPQPEGLARCLAAADRKIPPGSRVVFSSPPGEQDAAFYRWRWAAYLLPAQHVIPPEQKDAGRLAEYFIAYGIRVDNPRIELIERLPGCRIYRVRPAGPA